MPSAVDIAHADHLRLFNNANYSDIRVRFLPAGIEFPAHRIILARSSPPIYNILMLCPETKILFIQSTSCEESAYSYWRVFQYMYEESYSISPTETLDGIGRFREFRSLQRTEFTS